MIITMKRLIIKLANAVDYHKSIRKVGGKGDPLGIIQEIVIWLN